MSKTTYQDLGKLLEDVKDGTIIDGSIIINEDTGERVLLREGSMHFLTSGDYVSEEVPLARGMILAKWSVEKPKHKLIDVAEAFKKVADGIPVKVNGKTTSSVEELLTELVILQALSLSKANGVTYAIDHKHSSPSKFARKTTETDAWAILMDSNFLGYSAEKISDKYGISIRNTYYILDGTHYGDVHKRFHQLRETGELHFGRN